MNALRRLWTAWLSLLTHKEAGYGIAILRIVAGIAILSELSGPLRHNLVPLLWLPVDAGGYMLQPNAGWRFELLGGVSPEAVYTLITVGLIAGATLLVGVAGRLSAFIALQCFIALTDLNLSAGGSDDYLISNVLWLLVLADSTATGSLTARWKTGRFWPGTPVAAWPRYLVILQLVVMYTSTGLQKMSAHWVPWGDLSALYYIVQQPTWGRFPIQPSPWLYPATQAITLLTWVWEVGAPVLLLAMWWRYTSERGGRLRHWSNRLDLRSWFLAYGFFMHLGIFSMMQVGMFSIMSVATYACAYHPDEYRALWARIRSKIS